jgi:hypothetical protein
VMLTSLMVNPKVLGYLPVAELSTNYPWNMWDLVLFRLL